MSAAFVTFTPEAEEYITWFYEHDDRPLSLSLVYAIKVTSKDGRVVLDDRDWSLSISRDAPADDCVSLCIGGRSVYMRFATFQQVVGRTVYLSHGHSSDTSVTCGDLLKLR